MNTYVETLYLRASALITDNKIDEALELYHEILSCDPTYGKAHNDLGWIYVTKFSDYTKAESHFTLALKYDPELPYVYLHLGRLYTDKRAYNKALDVLQKGLRISGADVAALYSAMAYVYECQFDYVNAIRFLKLAKMNAGNTDFMEWIKSDKKRVKMKMNTLEKIQVLLVK